MNTTNPRSRMRALADEIRRHDDLYFNQDAPTISDSAYDALHAELVTLERAHPEFADSASPTQRVGGVAGTMHAPVEHRVPMLSLEKAHDMETMQKFFTRVARDTGNGTCVASPKLDGVAVSLVYERGLFVRGASRGDGRTGEDLTANLRHVPGVPLTLAIDGEPATMEIRGEVIMTGQRFTLLNERQAARGDKVFANPRNAAAGTVRAKTLDKERLADLDFHAYWAVNADGTDRWATATETMERLARITTAAAPVQVVNDVEGLTAYLNTLDPQGDIGMDGAVIRVDDNAAAAALGTNTKASRAAIAYKFSDLESETAIIGVDFQVGRTGVLTPVGKLEPVEVSGATVSSVTIHNCRMLQDMKVAKGDRIAIVRSGDVIPKIVRVVKHEGGEQIALPTACPACGGEVKWQSVNLTCTNDSCGGRLVQRLSHMVGRDALDMEGFGDQRLQDLVDRGLVKRPADLFALTARALAAGDRLGAKSADNLMAAVDGARTQSLARVLYSLGIDRFGRTATRVAAESFGNAAAIRATTPEVLSFLKGVQYEAAVGALAALAGTAGEDLDLMFSRGVKPVQDEAPGMRAEIIDVLAHVEYLAKAGADMPKVPTGAIAKWKKSGKPTATIQDLVNWGDRTLWAVKDDPRVGALLTALNRELGVTFEAPVVRDGVLAGKVILVTGTLDGYDRKAAQALIVDNGGTVATAVSGKCDLIVLGAKPGGSKVKKAESLGLTTISGDEFLASIK